MLSAENVSGSFLPAVCPDVDILKTALRQRFLLPILAKSAFLFSCIYLPCCLVYLYTITLPLCSLNKKNARSFPGAAASPSESTAHRIPAFLCLRVYTPFPRDLQSGTPACKDIATQLDGFWALLALWKMFSGGYFRKIVCLGPWDYRNLGFSGDEVCRFPFHVLFSRFPGIQILWCYCLWHLLMRFHL